MFRTLINIEERNILVIEMTSLILQRASNVRATLQMQFVLLTNGRKQKGHESWTNNMWVHYYVSDF